MAVPVAVLVAIPLGVLYGLTVGVVLLSTSVLVDQVAGRAGPELTVQKKDHEWDNFRHEALILELEVKVRNRRRRRKGISSFAMELTAGGSGLVNPDVWREVEARRNRRNRLDRTSVLEPRRSLQGWMVYAFPWNGGRSGPPDYTFSVMDEVGIKYVAGEHRWWWNFC